jgi:hypothetical protein
METLVGGGVVDCGGRVGATQIASRDFGRGRLKLMYLLAGTLLAGVPLFYLGVFGYVTSDHEAHIQFIQRGIREGVWPVHFLYPAIVYGLSGFSSDFTRLAWTALVVLSLCFAAKVLISYRLLAGRPYPVLEIAGNSRLAIDEDTPARRHATLLVLVTAALVLSSPLLRPWHSNRVYLGQISPNIWHNPTSVICWPIVILLFFAAEDFLRTARLRQLLLVGSLSALSVLAKPNYFLAFAPVFGLLGLWRLGLSRAWLLSQVAMIPTLLILCWQLTASFDGPQAMRAGWHIAWAPLAAWRIHSNSIILSLLFSLAFPLSYIVMFRHTLKNRDLLIFAWGVMLSALVWVLGFAEVSNVDGSVGFDFNFSWGAHLSIFVLFLATAIDMVENPQALSALSRNGGGRLMMGLPWWLLAGHAASGIYWMIRQAIGEGFV